MVCQKETIPQTILDVDLCVLEWNLIHRFLGVAFVINCCELNHQCNADLHTYRDNIAKIAW